MKFSFPFSAFAQIFAVLSLLFVFSTGVSAQTIPLNVSLDNVLSVDATVTIQQSTILNGQLSLTATVSGTAVVNGVSASVATQPITVTASTTCKSGTGTLTLTTSSIVLDLSNGLRTSVSPLTIKVTASCGKTPTLTLTLSPATISISDGTVLSVSQCTVNLSSPSSTIIGNTVCTLKNTICELTDILSAGVSTSDAISKLNQILSNLTNALP